MKYLLSLLVVLLSFSCAIAQPKHKWDTKSKKAGKYLDAAIECERQLNNYGYPDYDCAIENCDKAIAKDPEFMEAYYLKAEFCMKSGRTEEAIDAYHKLIQLPGFQSRTGYIYYELANLEIFVGRYEDALKHADMYIKCPGNNPELVPDMQWIVACCEFAIDAKKNPYPFEPVNVGAGVNTADPEYFPTLTVDQKQLLFTRRVTNYRNGQWQEDFFVSTDDNGYWATGIAMPDNINTTFNEGAPTFAPDGRTLIFVGCAIERVGYGPNRRGYGSCDLFITQKVGDEWTDPLNLPGGVNSRNWETQPSLSSDGKTLYFIRGNVQSSGGRNMRNGDIYVSYLQEDGSWSTAKKLPDNINTPYSEASVMIHPNGRTLYFASNGHIGMGGYDLYMTQMLPDSSWTDPINLGYPINTENDENSLLVFADGKFAVFASDRPGGMGSLDLYQFKMPPELQPDPVIYMTGTVFNSETKDKLQAEFVLKDLETGNIVITSYSDPVNGSFLVTLPVNREYGLFVEKDGYHPYSVNFNLTVPENSDEPYHRDVPLKPLNAMGDEIVLENVFFDLNSYTLRKESFIELDNLVKHLNNHPSMKIELQGHTDAQGNDDDNMTLSKNRAKAVMEYLISKGIDKERLSYKGFGETKPATIEVDGKEVQLTEEYIEGLPTDKEKRDAHQLNRRTVYVVKSL